MKGVILAAGEGSRIQRVTYGAYPKELLPIGNIPTIRFPIEAMRLAGIRNILVVIAPRTKHGIVDGLQNGENFGVEICYVIQKRDERKITGLGQAILSVKGWIEPEESFVVACGDTILCDFSETHPLDCIRPLLKIHESTEAVATVLVHPTHVDPRRFGLVKFHCLQEKDGMLYGGIQKLVEKPDLETARLYKANGYYHVITGYYLFKPRIFEYIEKTPPSVNNEIQITDAMRLAIEHGDCVQAVVHGRNHGSQLVPCDYWDVGVPEVYKEANRRLLDEDLDKYLYVEKSP